MDKITKTVQPRLSFLERVKNFMLAPYTTKGNSVIPFIGGKKYFMAVSKDIEEITGSDPGNSFIHLAGWWLDPTLEIGGKKLTDTLKEKSRQGVDVRVLGWVMPYTTVSNYAVQSSGEKPMAEINRDTMLFINELREEPTLRDKACLNIVSHPAGAVHMKMLAMGNKFRSIGYTGGIDMQRDRASKSWHDVAVRVQGPATQGFYDLFKLLWNENLKRPVCNFMIEDIIRTSGTLPGVTCDSHFTGTPRLSSRTLACPDEGDMYVEGLQTLPQFNFPLLGSLAATFDRSIFPTNTPLIEAPSGRFEIKEGWQKAISAARHYIYMEDQAFWSTEVCDWLNQAVKQNDKLQVVLLIGKADPNDAPNDDAIKFFTVAINEHLLKDLTPSQIERIGCFSQQEQTVHTKSTIIDDEWAMIGSANCMRRSLYTDIEHSIAFMDESGETVTGYRLNLWKSHLAVEETNADEAMKAWFLLPYAKKGANDPVVRLSLPFPAQKLDKRAQVHYDEIYDVDSTQTWGTQLVKQAASEQAKKVKEQVGSTDKKE